MNKNFKAISVTLTLCMLCSLLPTNVFGKTVEKLTRNTSISNYEAKLIQEDISKREKNVKHFLKDDFTYEAVVYPEAVHYKDGETWKEIDNSIVQMKDDDNNEVLTNKSNDFKVMIAKTANAKKLVSLKKDSYELSWNIENSTSVSEAVYKQPEATKTDKSELTTTVDNLFSDVTFRAISQDIDLKYQIRPETIKEDIVINKKGYSPEFTFNLFVNNLEAKLCKDNTIIFTDKKDSGKEVFKINAPFMYDAKGELSNNIILTFEENKNGYKLTMKPDLEWLNSSDREYPVTIDPVVTTELTAAAVDDSMVSSANPTTNYGSAQYFYASQVPGTNTVRSYLKFTLPTLTTADMVTEAKLYARVMTHNAENKVSAYKITGSWSESSITWDNQPTVSSTLIDYKNIDSNSLFSWDITRCVNSWYTVGYNYGIMLKADESSTTTKTNVFYSSDYSTSSYRPYLEISYINNAGLEDYWTYHSQQVGRAGTVYTNDYNGNIVVVHDDLVMNGNRMPVTLQHVFNYAYKTVNNGFGRGWNLNLNQSITPETINGNQCYVYLDQDGTKHYFSDIGTGVYKDESGLNLTLEIDTQNGTKSIIDKTDNILSFNSSGQLTSVEDNNGNTITLSYTNSKLTSITDGAGRITNLVYYPTGNTFEGYLWKIVDPSQRETIYEYSPNGDLYTITYPDNLYSRYLYNSDPCFTITDHTGYRIRYYHYSTSPYRLSEIEEDNSDQTQGQLINITYGSNETQWETQYPQDDKKKSVYQFNNYGNTISQMDNIGNTQYFQYGDYSNRDSRNKLVLESRLQIPVLNKAISNSSNWTLSASGSSTGNGGCSTAVPKYFGNEAFWIEKTNTAGRHFLEQEVNLSDSGMTAGETYTLSAFVKTESISKSDTAKGASLFVTYKDSSNNTYYISESSYINGTLGWQKAETNFQVPSGVTDIYINLGINEETGKAYFDNVQLEKGPVSNRCNCVDNPDFTYASPLGWSKSSSCESTDTRVTSSDSDYPENLDNNCFQITGESDLAKNVYFETATPNGQAGDVYSIGCWAKADSIPNILTNRDTAISNTDRVFGLVFEFTYADSSTQTFLVPFNPNSSEWQYVCDRVEAPYNYTNIKLMGCYYNNANTAYFDGFQLYKEEFGARYSYDTNGNITGTTTSSGEASSYVYNSTNDMTSSTSSGGTETSIEYENGDHNATEVTTEDEVSNYSYDAYGNLLTSTEGEGSLFINSSTAYTTSGNYVDTTTDPSGNTTDYSFHETKGTLNSVKDAKNSTTTYSYDSNLDRLTGVSKTVDGATVSNTYSYKDSSNVETDKLTKITHNGFDYNFNYDSLGNMTSVYAGSQALITNNYEARSSKLLDSTYGNSQEIGYDYDKLDRITAINYNNTERYKYYYDSDGNLAYYENRTDLGSSSSSYYTQRYTYDLSSRPVKTEEKTSTQKNIALYSYDDEGLTGRVEENIGSRNYYTGHLYDGTGNETQTYFNRYGINSGTVEYFPLNNNTTGSLGTKPTTETVTFANDENNVPAFSATTGNTLVYDIKPVVKPQAGTMAFWFTTTGTGTRYLVSNNKTDGGNLSIYINSSNKLVVEVKKTDGTMYNLVTASSITIPTTQNTWNFAAMSWSISGSTLTCNLYVMDPSNQYQLTSFQGTMTSTDCMDFTGASTAVGSTVTGASNLTGLVGMFAYYKNVLNSTYINSILSSGRNSAINNTYDSLGRITEKEITTGVYKSTGANANYVTDYSYVPGANSSSTYLLQSMTNGANTISYTYDANNNIQTMTQSAGTITYSYNELNELKREDNQVLSKTNVYAYDAGGNITSRTEYNYTDPAVTPSNPLNVYTYTYDTVWKDKLTNYNGSSLTYDAIGNVTSDGTRTYTWEEGRNLASITMQGVSLAFKYNDSGIRTEKTVDGNTTRYHLDGDKVTYEKTASGDDIYYTYDSDEKLVSMNLNGTEYYYVRNGQGDIIALIDKTVTEVVSYTYDTWGKVISVSGTLASTVGAKNPYRYRGYRYDSETGLYYLQSRYYNPEWGRFINADDTYILLFSQGELLSPNQFSYCINNPVNNVDQTGYKKGITKTKKYWWGVRFWFDSDKANDVSLKMNSAAGKLAVASAISAGISKICSIISAALAPTGAGTAIAAAFKIAFELVAWTTGLVSGYLWSMSADLAWKNKKSTGVILDFNYALFYSVKAQ